MFTQKKLDSILLQFKLKVVPLDLEHFIPKIVILDQFLENSYQTLSYLNFQ